MHGLEFGKLELQVQQISLLLKSYLYMSVIHSLQATCKAHNVTPREYLNDGKLPKLAY